jgi:hypothetical protein
MQATLTKSDIEDAVRRALDTHTRSPWYDTEAAAVYLSSTPGTLRSWRGSATGPRYHVFHSKTFAITSPTSTLSFAGRTVDERFHGK